MTTAEIDELEAKWKASTQGEWVGATDRGMFAGGNKVFETGCGCCTSESLTDGNAQFIAAAHNDFPQLIQAARRLIELESAAREAERLRAEVLELRSQLNTLPKTI